ncbi:putative membrane-bound dehydrogenase domain-containing protein [Fodinibius roseus]|uniref:Putative membrane-bound dehydrogenase domain-containing protein n=1 Tax=Fodinibius roseus TaxID=1194090 RepID=A0A1M5KDG4_9BACT|nr:PVC-type heme-binding CxxCH protein [Fodinibius roseus]SHG50797.1 putative membrane-bound dehydrogenase domain-containing protein [Fodinibius roseus]
MKRKTAAWVRVAMYVLSIGLLIGCSGGDREPACQSPPCEPETAAGTFEVADGFQVELFAAEPLISDPVGMTVDEEGRLYVVEDPGYPENPGDFRGRVRLLEDSDGDGRPDQSSIFADQFRAPRGVMRWKEGLLVTDATEIVYLEDTDGDGQADVREVMMGGFNYNNPQLGVNSPLYGLDNWVYVAHRQGSRPHFAGEPKPEEIAARTNIRFRPDAREWESLSGASQFGHSFDAFGRHLLVYHNNHIYQEIMAARYLSRNPDLMVAPSSASISDHGTAAEVYPVTENEGHELFTDAGAFTAACGITCYLGGQFPGEYEGAAFVAEPAHNLVHADRLEESGAALTASRIQAEREFLASTDHWFRPVNFYVGPDGALYIIDYYRQVIEQPRFLSEEALQAGIHGGSDRGRIYRVTVEGAETPSWLGQLSLGEAPAGQLVERLDHANGWWRTTAQRLLTDRQDEAAIEPLKELVETGSRPEARVHALWTLAGMEALSADLIETGLADGSPRVREQAIRLAEQQLDQAPDLADRLLAMAGEEDAGVRFQLLNTLGALETPEAREVRRELLYAHIEDEWMQLAALSAGDLDYRTLYEEARSRLSDRETEGRSTYFRRLGALIGVGGTQEAVRELAGTIAGRPDTSGEWWQAASLQGLAEGLQYGGEDGNRQMLRDLREPMARLALDPDAPALRNAARSVMTVVGPPEGASVFAAAEELAADNGEDPLLRRDAIRLLGVGPVGEYAGMLMDLVSPEEPPEVQAAAARTLQDLEGPEIGKRLLSGWDQMTPPVRRAAMETMLADDDRISLVFDAIEEGELSPSAVSWNDTKRLMLHSDEGLQRRAKALLGGAGEERSEIVERYEAALSEQGEGNTERGQEVFERSCAMCHQIDGEGGVNFGPDLASVRTRSPEELLVDILMPGEAIAAGYEQYRIERQDGSTLQGAIASETSQSVTLRDMGGQETTVPRSDIEQMEAVGGSVMPTGLERQISEEEMNDLIAYIKGK